MSHHPEPLPSDLADAIDRVRGRLDRIASRIVFFSSIGSTNDVAARLAADADPEGTVVIADQQSSGRGRQGRTWFSPPGAGLYVSVILRPGRARQEPARATALLTLTAGVALSEGVERATGLGPDIKWPNDLLVGSRKLAGILAEGVTAPSSSLLQSVVLGYGINVGAANPPPELAARMTSLEQELGRAIDRAAVCAETLAALASRYGELVDSRFDAILDAWRQRAPGSIGRRVKWISNGREWQGTTAGIDDRGALLVRIDDRIERIVSGEVLWG